MRNSSTGARSARPIVRLVTDGGTTAAMAAVSALNVMPVQHPFADHHRPATQPCVPPAAVPDHHLWSDDIRLLRTTRCDAVTNMALDEALLRTAADTGATLVRLYEWDLPSLSLGRNQRAEGIYSAERCAALGVPVVRRLTGGRALLHAREVTYAVAAPTRAAPTLRGGYAAINALLLAALQRLGVPATLAAPTERETSPGLAPCFETPSAGELVVSGRKLAGSAQHRDTDAFLQHGSILLDDDQGLLHDLALVPLPAVPAPATLRELTRNTLGISDVEDAITAALSDVAGRPVRTMAHADLPAHHVAAALTRYRDASWTWRR